MTHVMAWHRGDRITLVADSALSAPFGHFAKPESHTSFGEPTDIGNRIVEERALKLIRFEECCVGFAGVYSTAIDSVRALARELVHHATPQEAFERAVDSVTPLGDCRNLQLLMAWREGQGVRLGTFNVKYDESIVYFDEPGVVHIGSAPLPSRIESAQFAGAVGRDFPDHDSQTVALVAAMQLRSIWAPLNEHQIGGVHTACTVSADEVSWVPDATYLVRRPDGVPALINRIWMREDSLFLHAAPSNRRSVFGTSLSERSRQLFADRPLLDRMTLELATTKVSDFVVIASLATPGFALVEVRGQADTRWLNTRFNFDLNGAPRAGILFEVHDRIVRSLVPARVLAQAFAGHDDLFESRVSYFPLRGEPLYAAPLDPAGSAERPHGEIPPGWFEALGFPIPN